MMTEKDYAALGTKWRQIFHDKRQESIRNVDGNTATLELDTADLQELVELCSALVEARGTFPFG